MAVTPRRQRPTIRRRSKLRPTQRRDEPAADPVEGALLESFPASDPPSTTPIRYIGGPPRPPSETPKRGRK